MSYVSLIRELLLELTIMRPVLLDIRLSNTLEIIAWIASVMFAKVLCEIACIAVADRNSRLSDVQIRYFHIPERFLHSFLTYKFENGHAKQFPKSFF